MKVQLNIIVAEMRYLNMKGHPTSTCKTIHKTKDLKLVIQQLSSIYKLERQTSLSNRCHIITALPLNKK